MTEPKNKEEYEQKQLNLRARLMHFIVHDLQLTPAETIAMLADTLGHVVHNVVDGRREESIEVLEEIHKMLTQSVNRICDERERDKKKR